MFTSVNESQKSFWRKHCHFPLGLRNSLEETEVTNWSFSVWSTGVWLDDMQGSFKTLFQTYNFLNPLPCKMQAISHKNPVFYFSFAGKIRRSGNTDLPAQSAPAAFLFPQPPLISLPLSPGQMWSTLSGKFQDTYLNRRHSSDAPEGTSVGVEGGRVLPERLDQNIWVCFQLQRFWRHPFSTCSSENLGPSWITEQRRALWQGIVSWQSFTSDVESQHILDARMGLGLL